MDKVYATFASIDLKGAFVYIVLIIDILSETIIQPPYQHSTFLTMFDR